MLLIDQTTTEKTFLLRQSDEMGLSLYKSADIFPFSPLDYVRFHWNITMDTAMNNFFFRTV
jgi:hypothetical protein